MFINEEKLTIVKVTRTVPTATKEEGYLHLCWGELFVKVVSLAQQFCFGHKKRHPVLDVISHFSEKFLVFLFSKKFFCVWKKCPPTWYFFGHRPKWC